MAPVCSVPAFRRCASTVSGLPLQSVCVALWIRATDAAIQSASQRASPRLDWADHERLRQMQHPARRQQFLAIRALRAQALQGGRHTAPIHCSLAHSEQWLVVATAPHPLGVDVQAGPELERRIRVAQRVFAPTEQAWLAQVTGETHLQRWLLLWTAREAAVKAGLMSVISAGPPWVDDHGGFQPPVAHAWGQLPDGALVSVVVPAAASVTVHTGEASVKLQQGNDWPTLPSGST